MLFSSNFSDQVWKAGEKKECRFVFAGKARIRSSWTVHGMSMHHGTSFQSGDKVYANVEWVLARSSNCGMTAALPNSARRRTEHQCPGPVDIDQYVRKDKPPADKPERKKRVTLPPSLQLMCNILNIPDMKFI